MTTTPVEQRVLGYDAREMWTTGTVQWLEQRRNKYLLRPEVAKPLSTDTSVWPSIFAQPSGPDPEAAYELEAPAWTGPIQYLWDDLTRLTAALDAAWGKDWRPCRLIAVTLLYGRYDQEERERWDQRIVGMTPPAVSEAWEFLGYDVSDGWLLSGLSNCGYGEAAESLRQEWAPHLNEHHLFDDLDKAVGFEAMTDVRVEEHAPFYVYGIYSIPRETVPRELS